MKLTFLVTAAVIAASSPALSAVPKISGDYAFSARALCQPTIQVQHGRDRDGLTFVNGLNVVAPNSCGFEVDTAKLDTSSMTVSYSSTTDSGTDILRQLTNGTQQQAIRIHP